MDLFRLNPFFWDYCRECGSEELIGTCWGWTMELGKLLLFLGVGLVVAGALLMLLGRMNIPLGRLPGDFLYRGKNTTVYFPLATSVVVSVVLSILLYIVSRWRK